MTVTNSYDGNTPTVGADANAWGGELNTALNQIKTTLDAYATAINANETLATAALPKAGGTMTGDIILAATGPGGTRSVGYRGAPIVNLSSSKALALTDLGCTVRLTGVNSRTLTINPVGTTGYPVGSVVELRCDDGTGQMTIARGAGVSLRIPGSSTDADRTLAVNGFAYLQHEATNRWLVSGTGIS